jgi:hypothetical protein
MLGESLGCPALLRFHVFAYVALGLRSSIKRLMMHSTAATTPKAMAICILHEYSIRINA